MSTSTKNGSSGRAPVPTDLRVKGHLIVALVLMELAVIGLGQASSQGSAIPLSELYNRLTGSANRIGARFPSVAMYDARGKIKPLRHSGRLTLIVFIGCDCSIPQSNRWASAARLNGENVIQVFPGSPAKLRHIAKHHVIEGTAVTCPPGKAAAALGSKDFARLPIGYHIDSGGMLISKQL